MCVYIYIQLQIYIYIYIYNVYLRVVDEERPLQALAAQGRPVRRHLGGVVVVDEALDEAGLANVGRPRHDDLAWDAKQPPFIRGFDLMFYQLYVQTTT